MYLCRFAGIEHTLCTITKWKINRYVVRASRTTDWTLTLLPFRWVRHMILIVSFSFVFTRVPGGMYDDNYMRSWQVKWYIHLYQAYKNHYLRWYSRNLMSPEDSEYSNCTTHIDTLLWHLFSLGPFLVTYLSFTSSMDKGKIKYGWNYLSGATGEVGKRINNQMPHFTVHGITYSCWD